MIGLILLLSNLALSVYGRDVPILPKSVSSDSGVIVESLLEKLEAFALNKESTWITSTALRMASSEIQFWPERLRQQVEQDARARLLLSLLIPAHSFLMAEDEKNGIFFNGGAKVENKYIEKFKMAYKIFRPMFVDNTLGQRPLAKANMISSLIESLHCSDDEKCPDLHEQTLVTATKEYDALINTFNDSPIDQLDDKKHELVGILNLLNKFEVRVLVDKIITPIRRKPTSFGTRFSSMKEDFLSALVIKRNRILNRIPHKPRIKV